MTEKQKQFFERELNSFLDEMVKEVAKSIKEGKPLFWQTPYFVRSLANIIQPFRHQSGGISHKPVDDPHVFSGLNSFFLYFGMMRSKERTGIFDNRFVPASALGKSKYGFLYKKGGRITINWDEINKLEGNEKKEAIIKAYRSREVVIFYPIIQKRDNQDFDPDEPPSKDNPEKIIFVSGWGCGKVVNVADTNLVSKGILPPAENKEKRENPPIEKLEAILKFPHEYETAPTIPNYNYRTKKIQTPGLSLAKSALDHYATVLHELAHQLGDMIGNDNPSSKNRPTRSERELTAELTSAYVLAKLGYSENHASKQAQNSVAYLKSWADLTKDPQILFRAAKEAQQRGDILLSGEIPYDKIKHPETFPWLPVKPIKKEILVNAA